jgi:hypothetical protein
VDTSKYVMAALKMLLEQGDDIFFNPGRKGFMYWIAGPYILMSVVLSNAYKGNNITRLSAPRNPIPMDTFTQLFENGFDFYSEFVSTYTRIEMFPARRFSFKETSVFEVWREDFEKSHKDKDNLSRNQQIIQRLDGKIKVLKFGILITEEELKTFSICNNTALLGLKSNLRSNIYKTVRKLNKNPNVDYFIGKESLMEYPVGWKVWNNYDPELYNRIRSVESHGFINYWESLRLEKEKRQTPKKLSYLQRRAELNLVFSDSGPWGNQNTDGILLEDESDDDSIPQYFLPSREYKVTGGEASPISLLSGNLSALFILCSILLAVSSALMFFETYQCWVAVTKVAFNTIKLFIRMKIWKCVAILKTFASVLWLAMKKMKRTCCSRPGNH